MSYIYILTNESMPHMIKVGMTAKHPEERAKELHTTGVPMPFKVAAMWEVPPSELRTYEKRAHSALKEYHSTKNREFFEVSAEKASKILDKVIPSIEKIQEKIKLDDLARREKQKEHSLNAKALRIKQLEEKKENLERAKITLLEQSSQQNTRIAEIDLLLEGKESIFAKSGSAIIKLFGHLLLMPIKYLWAAIILSTFLISEGSMAHKAMLSFAAYIAAMFLSPILITLILPVFSALLKTIEPIMVLLGPTHVQLRSEKLRLAAENEAVSKKLNQITIELNEINSVSA